MKIFTSYFYKVRFFKPYMIPFSTAAFDPKWYHNSQGSQHIFLDKNRVYNGIRIPPLSPWYDLHGLCKGKECSDSPDNCEFLKRYREQLDRLDVNEMMEMFKSFCPLVEWTGHEPYMVLLFHEAPNNPCSERRVVTEWLRDNGINVEELSVDQDSVQLFERL